MERPQTPKPSLYHREAPKKLALYWTPFIDHTYSSEKDHILAMQLPRFLEYHQANSMDTYAIILSTSVIALTYNIVHSLMIQQTSAVTTTVIGEAKIIGLLILSYVLLGEDGSPYGIKRPNSVGDAANPHGCLSLWVSQ